MRDSACVTRSLALACLLCASTVAAQPSDPPKPPSLKLPTIVYAGAAAADLVSTYAFLSDTPLKEANPLLFFTDSKPVPTVLVGAAADVVTLLVLHHFLGESHPKALAVGLYVAAGVRVGLAARNFTNRARYGTRCNLPGPVVNPACH